MKTIGIIGGVTWVSSAEYYRLFNELANERLGGDEMAELVMYSVNFRKIKELSFREDWKSISNILCDAAKKLEAAGAECIVIGANTMHIAADDIRAAVNLPLIHIADAVANAIVPTQLDKILLLGTRYLLQTDMYKNALKAKGIELIIPGEQGIEMVNKSIYNEFSRNLFLPKTKKNFIHLINGMAELGAQGVILGCTEIPLLIKPEEIQIPMFDTIKIHVNAALDFALA